jgi:O-acetyl-ADP-ribose deacetylase (regulator of RNase III)
MMLTVHNSRIELHQGDITELAVDAIVNAANKHLLMGGGVAGAIRKKGGRIIQQECNKIGGTSVGSAVITTAGSLAAKHVIHAVGPRLGEGNEDEKLRNATINSLKLAEKHKLRLLAFPAISTGIFGFPVDRCAQIMLSTTYEYLHRDTCLEKVLFCLYSSKDYDIFEDTLKSLFL